MDLDVLAVQEVEDIGTLKRFVIDNLGGLYPHVVLVEGNDPRLIDVAVLSKLPIGAVTSWQRAVHASEPGTLVFGRDLLQVEILDANRTRRLFTVFNTHLKSRSCLPVRPRTTRTGGDRARPRSLRAPSTRRCARTARTSCWAT